jgi:hypothetical protein
MNDIFNDPPPTYYDDDERFGTGVEMIAEIRRLLAENARLSTENAKLHQRIGELRREDALSRRDKDRLAALGGEPS